MISIVNFILHIFTGLLTGCWPPPVASWACWTGDPPWPPRGHWSGSPHLYCHSAACCDHLYSQCALQRWGQTGAGCLCWLCGPHRRRSCHNQHPRALSGSGPRNNIMFRKNRVRGYKDLSHLETCWRYWPGPGVHHDLQRVIPWWPPPIEDETLPHTVKDVRH